MKKFAAITDEELAMMYVGGNNEAFDELLERNQSKIFNYILFLVKDQETANDLFQDTFVKVISKLHEGKYAIQGKFSYWISRIAHNIIIDWYRQQSYERCVDVNKDNDLSNIRLDTVLEGGRENELFHEQVLVDVKRLMDNLPATQREVVFMRFYQKLSFKEIAEITGVSINTSLGRMRYAINNMRRLAKKHDVVLIDE